MQLEFAKREADRRTKALGTTHYVVIQPEVPFDEYMVLTRVPKGYKLIHTCMLPDRTGGPK